MCSLGHVAPDAHGYTLTSVPNTAGLEEAFMRTRLAVLATAAAAVTVGLNAIGAAQTQKVPLIYWQYQFDSKVALVADLIKEFNAANPGIEVKQENFPYDNYIAKVKSSLGAGQGPDVVNLFYGWIPDWVAGGYLAPLPEQFPAKDLEASVGPLVKSSQVGGLYYTVPTAVRSLAVFYNKALFKAAGIAKIPRTWDQFEAAAKKIQKMDGGKVSVAGIALAPTGQDHHLFREVLSRQWGGKPYTPDFKKVLYNSPQALEAFKWYTGLIERGAAANGEDLFPGSNNAYRDSFIAGRAGMIIDGSFAIGGIRSGAKFDWGTFELPTKTVGGLKANFGSYWAHGLTKNATGPKLEAGIKWLKFLTSEAVQRRWLEKVGEIPASTTLAKDATLRRDPIYGPFFASLPFAKATFFADEAGQRKAMADAMKSVWLTKTDPAVALKASADAEQKILTDFFTK
jgi:multiple sugar transport system substrate-binding protein